jgi:hypothetical protein
VYVQTYLLKAIYTTLKAISVLIALVREYSMSPATTITTITLLLMMKRYNLLTIVFFTAMVFTMI